MKTPRSVRRAAISGMVTAIIIVIIIVVAGAAAYFVFVPPGGGTSSVTTTGTGSVSPNSGIETNQTLINAATKEGSVDFYGVISPPIAANLSADFSSVYPGITVNFQRVVGPYPNIQSEQASGKYWGDVVYDTTADLEPIRQAGWLVPITNPPPVATSLPSNLIASDHTYYGNAYTVYILAYNTKQVNASQVPKSWTDLCNPMWKGKLGMPDPVSFDLVIGWFYAMKAVLGNNWSTVVNCIKNDSPKYFATLTPVAQGIATGQVAIGLTLTASMAPNVIAGDPVAVDTNLSPLVSSPNHAAIIKHAPHPNAARLFWEYVLGTRAQKLLANVGGWNTVAGFAPSYYSSLANIPVVPIGYLNKTQLANTRTEMGLPWNS